MRTLISTLLLVWLVWSLPSANALSVVAPVPVCLSNSSTVSRIIGYDAHNGTTHGYDIQPEPAFAYDESVILLACERHQARSDTSEHFGAFTELLAAERTAVQLEFPFARGASVQTPGITTAGETFVRVGAGPQNLRFGSTSLSGAQPGTYAFPETTFNSIGQNPAALRNFGDLPGAAPQYFRTLQPPAGTPIQRGIVPGGQFGGAGGVPEVIFPRGF